MDGPNLLSPEIMFEEVFSHKNGRFRNWWRARLYDDLLVFYPPHLEDDGAPVKAWRKYDQVWD